MPPDLFTATAVSLKQICPIGEPKILTLVIIYRGLKSFVEFPFQISHSLIMLMSKDNYDLIL